MARTAVVLEATRDRSGTAWLGRLLRLIPGGLGDVTGPQLRTSYTPRREITHWVDVRAHAAAKRRAMAEHLSQATGSRRGPRLLGVLRNLPLPLFKAVLGVELFVEHGRRPGREDDVFASLRRPPG